MARPPGHDTRPRAAHSSREGIQPTSRCRNLHICYMSATSNTRDDPTYHLKRVRFRLLWAKQLEVQTICRFDPAPQLCPLCQCPSEHTLGFFCTSHRNEFYHYLLPGIHMHYSLQQRGLLLPPILGACTPKIQL
jgi:hypothetical protein